jgi:hypothetical protein
MGAVSSHPKVDVKLSNSSAICENNVGLTHARENRTNQKWTIKKHCQHWLHRRRPKTPDEDKAKQKKNQHNTEK